MKNNDIEEFLKLNPQLKKIELLNCENIDGRISLSIARHTPHIEVIHIDAHKAINHSNLTYVGKLNSLNKLKLSVYTQFERIIDTTFMPSIPHEIRRARISLQHLHINGQYSSKLCDITELVEVMSELKLLKTLWLIGVPEMKLSNVFRLCRQLEQLSEIILILGKDDKDFTPSTVAEYVETAEMIAQRHVNTPLVFKVHSLEEIPFSHIPRDTIRQYND